MEEEYEIKKIKRLQMIFLLSIVATLVITIIILKIVWSANWGQPKNDDVNISFAEIPSDIESKRDFISNYTITACENIKYGNIDKLYDMLSDDYIKQTNMTQDKLKVMLEQKGLLNKQYRFSSFSEGKLSGKTIYRVDIASEEDNIRENIMIYEDSPREYKIGFNNYVESNIEDIKQKNYGVLIEIKNIRFSINTLEFNISITNQTSKKVVLNSDVAQENVYLIKKSSQVDEKSLGSFVSQRTITLEPNQTHSGNAKFSIGNLDFESVLGIKVKDIYVEELQEIKTMVLNLQ